MANHSILIILLMCCSAATFAQEDSTLQPGCVKETSNSSTCNIQFQKSKLKEVLRLQREPTNNVVKIRTFGIFKNKIRYFPEMTWASEIGRTIITLIKHAEKKKVFASPMFTWILTVGMEEVDIKVDIKLNASDDCLKIGTKEIFNSLLRELFSHSADTHFYELCQTQDNAPTPYNCCQIIGDEKLKICSNYSSVVVKLALPAVIVIFCISSLFVVPFLLEYIVRYPSNDEPGFYKTSESHMSLNSVFSMIFFEGRGPVKSFFRRSVFAGLLLLVFYPTDFFESYCLQVTFCTWCAVFLVTYDVQMTNDKFKEECNELCKSEKGCLRTQWGKDILSCFTIPFFLVFFDWKKRFQQKIQNPICGENPFHCLFQAVCGLCGCVLIALLAVIYLVLVVVCLIKFTMFDLIFSFILPHSCYSCGLSCVIDLWVFAVRLGTLANIGLLIGMILMLALFIVVGLSLNAAYFNPFLASTLALILFVWKNWTFSVEGRCLQLKTSIIEICKEKAHSAEDQQEVNCNPKSEPDCCKLFSDFFCRWFKCCNRCGQAPRGVPRNGPTIGSIEATTETSLHVTWEKLADNDSNGEVTRYKIYYIVGSAAPTEHSPSKIVTGADSTTVDLTELQRATQYTVAVQAFNRHGGGPLGAPRNETTRNVPARGPNIRSIVSTTPTSLQVTWEQRTNNDPNEEVTKYKIYYTVGSTAPHNRSPRKIVTGADPTMADLTGLRPNTTYNVAVQAFNRFGGGPLGDVGNRKTANDTNIEAEGESENIGILYEGPTITSIERTTATSLHVTWEMPNGLNNQVTEYEIYYNIGPIVLHNCSTSKIVTGARNTKVDLTGLKPKTNYTVAVQAFNCHGSGPLGDSWNRTTANEPNIKFDEHGEAMIAKKLYDDISKEVLHSDHLLVLFFRRVIFVSVYAFALFIAMILARDSGVSEGVQAVSAIAGALIPLFFDNILADHHAAKKDANNMAMEEKLRHMLKVERLGKNIVVELINPNPNPNPNPDINEDEPPIIRVCGAH